jgi:hypothetical protein
MPQALLVALCRGIAGGRRRGLLCLLRRELGPQPRDFVRDLARWQHQIDAPGLYGVARHARDLRRIRRLREDDATAVLDGLNAKRTVGVAPRQDHTNRTLLARHGERLEQRVHGKVAL